MNILYQTKYHLNLTMTTDAISRCHPLVYPSYDISFVIKNDKSFVDPL